MRPVCRTYPEVRDDGTWIDRGGAWVGPGQDAIYGLMHEFGVSSYKQYTDGDAMLVVDGKQHEYRSFPTMGHAMHDEDPQLYVDTVVAWAKTLAL